MEAGTMQDAAAGLNATQCTWPACIDNLICNCFIDSSIPESTFWLYNEHKVHIKLLTLEQAVGPARVMSPERACMESLVCSHSGKHKAISW